MKSRMEKYYDEDTQNIKTRTQKNSELYQEIKNNDLDNFNIESNAKVIGENDSNYINVDRLKEILEKNYHNPPKRNQVKLVEEKEEEPIKLEQTREYDINTILEKAREEKEVDYEKERLKKVRDTQYDILKTLNIESEKNTTASSKTKEELLSLINTITENELHKTQMDPLDILTDLKGDDDTMIMGIKDFEEKKKVVPKKEEKEEFDNSFYTDSMTFKQKDFDDFQDIKEDLESNKIMIRVLIILIVLAFIAGVVILVNYLFKLGLF